MVDNLQTTFFMCIFMKENFGILIQISQKVVLKGQIDDNKSVLVQAMA